MRLAREALLAATMSLVPAAPVDVFRFLNVPAIVMVLRRKRGRVCRDVHKWRTERRRLGG
jgi:hypothetical protein